MSRGQHEIKRGCHPVIPIDQVVPAETVAQQLAPDDPEPPVGTNPSANGIASLAGNRSVEDHVPEIQGQGEGYCDRALGPEHHRPVLPERPAPLPRPAAVIWVAPEVAVAPVTVPMVPGMNPPLTAPEAPPSDMESVTDRLARAAHAPRRRGAHVRKDEPPIGGVGGAHVNADDPLAGKARGAHVKPDDPLARETWETQVSDDEALAVEVGGAHVRGEDSLPVDVVADGAEKGEAPPEETTEVGETEAPLIEVAEIDGRDAAQPGEEETANAGDGDAAEAEAPSKPRRRRWHVVPVAGAVGALVAGLGAGGAYAYFSSTGSGTGQTVVGSPVSVTVTAVSGPADLLPGGTGALSFTLHNPNPFGATFTQVATVGTPVSNNTVACPSSNVSIAQTLPYAFSPAVTVSAGGTSGTESIANLVQLAANAPSACQGVTFTVILTLSGTS